MKNTSFTLLFILSNLLLSAQSGLIRHYPLDGNANDVVGGFNGTVVGGVTPSADESASSSKAMYFNGTDGYIDIPISGLTTLNEYTYSACIRCTVNPPSSTAWSILSIGYSNKDQVVYLSNGGPSGQTGYGFGSYNTIASAADDTWEGVLPTVGQWYHLTAVRKSGMLKLYLDDFLIDSAFTTGSVAGYDATPTARIGSRSGASWGLQFFNGDMEDIQIYNRALSGSEINNLCSMTIGIHDNIDACVPKINNVNGVIYSSIETSCNIQNFSFEVMNIMGQLLFKTSDPNFKWSGKGNLSTGRYIYKIQGNIGAETFISNKSFFVE